MPPPMTRAVVPALTIRPAVQADAESIRQIAAESLVLPAVSASVYATWCAEFPVTSVVGEIAGKLVGFALGAPLRTSGGRLFIWQVAVDHPYRDRKVGVSMLDCLLDEVAADGIFVLEAVTAADAQASLALFAALARRRGARLIQRRYPDDCAGDPRHARRRIEIHRRTGVSIRTTDSGGSSR